MDRSETTRTAATEAHDGAAGRMSRRTVLGGAALVAAAGTVGRLVGPELRALGSRLDGPAQVTARATRIDPPDPPPPPGSYVDGARYVALYGHPGSRVLGALGEQGVAATVERARLMATTYVGFGRPVVPAFEILASVASSVAGADGDYSNEFGVDKFRPYVDAAAANGFHCVFDLQPGRARFPDQAREYAPLWRFPHVSIALDPEWRVNAPAIPGGGRIGSVDGSEVNETVDYLDAVVRLHRLPRKMLIVHQFTPSMITNKQLIRGTSNVQVVLHMDGFGPLLLKRGSYDRMVADLPAGALTGWKNFFDEDSPTPTPSQTLANDPRPMYVSFQ